MSNSNQQLFNRVDAILDGIDRQEDDPRGGWWHTEDGARVGRIKLRELKEHLITMAGTACAGAAPVNLAALHDPDFSAGLSPGEHLNRLCGVAPSRPALLPTEEEIATWLHLEVDSPVYLAEPDQPEDDSPAYWADDVPAFILEALKLWGQTAPIVSDSDREDFMSELCRIQEISLREGAGPRFNLVEFAMDHFFSGAPSHTPQPAALAQPTVDPSPVALGRSGLTPDEIKASFRDWSKERYGFESEPFDAVIEWTQFALPRSYRPTIQPVPVSERLPGPDDCCPNPRTGLGRWCWGWVQRDPIPYSGCWRMMRREGLFDEALAWAPWWAFPLPGSDSPGVTEEAGQVKP
jgi:hypothetical protein